MGVDEAGEEEGALGRRDVDMCCGKRGGDRGDYGGYDAGFNEDGGVGEDLEGGRGGGVDEGSGIDKVLAGRTDSIGYGHCGGR